MEWFGRRDVGEMLQYLWLNKHKYFCNARGSPVPISQRGLGGEAGVKHFIKLSLLSGNDFLPLLLALGSAKS